MIQTNPSEALFKKRIMNINDRLNKMSKEEMISLIKEIKITCESNRGIDTDSVIRPQKKLMSTLNFILTLIKGEL